MIVRPDEPLKAAHSQPPTIVSEYNLKVYSSWGDWSECSTCDMVGEKIRYGYCTISLLEELEHKNTAEKRYYKRENQNRYSHRKEGKIKRIMVNPIFILSEFRL